MFLKVNNLRKQNLLFFTRKKPTFVPAKKVDRLLYPLKRTFAGRNSMGKKVDQTNKRTWYSHAFFWELKIAFFFQT